MRVQVVGECMVEIARVPPPGQARISYSGDAYNTAVYLRRVATDLGVALDIHFLTGLGDDAESDRMRARWAEEGIVGDAVAVAGAGPGLYLISTDGDGERSFSYWRDQSAAAQVLAGTEWIDRLEGSTVYLSGISLQLMTPTSRRAMGRRLAELRATGSQVVFDSNYRAVGWGSAAEARAAMDDVLKVTDVALVTLDDELALGTCTDAGSCADRLHLMGVDEVVVKDGAGGALVSDGTGQVVVPVRPVVPVDTTAAGDSFNGAYLAARAAGAAPVEAAGLGNLVAGCVVQHPGAIIDADRMPGVCR